MRSIFVFAFAVAVAAASQLAIAIESMWGVAACVPLAITHNMILVTMICLPTLYALRWS